MRMGDRVICKFSKRTGKIIDLKWNMALVLFDDTGERDWVVAKGLIVK